MDFTAVSPSAALELVREGLRRYPWLQAADLSPDGSKVAYSVRVADDANAEALELWLWHRDEDRHEQVAAGIEASDPAWAPDGRSLAFTAADEQGDRQLFLLERDWREPRRLTDLRGVRGAPSWSPDGRRLLFVASPTAQDRDLDRPYRVTRRVWRVDGIGDVEAALAEIWELVVASEDVRQLTADGGIAGDPRCSPAGDAVLYRCGCAPAARDLRDATIRLYRGGESSILVPSAMRPVRAVWLPGGEGIAFLGQEPEVARSSAGLFASVYLLGLEPGAEPQLRPAGDRGAVNGFLQSDMPVPAIALLPSPLLVGAAGAWLLVRVQRGGACAVERVALGGAQGAEEILGGDRCCAPLALSDDESTLLALTSDFGEPAALALVDLRSGREIRVSPCGAEQPPAVPASLRPLQIVNDGEEVEAWFASAADSEEPVPTVLYAHGGPHLGMGHVFHLEIQQMLAAGFGVLLVNHHGSSGYGVDFAGSLRGRWGELDGGDLLAAVDAAVGRGWADPDHLGICGASGGGYLTCWLIGRTRRFKAAVAENPVINFASFYGSSDFGVGFVPDELDGGLEDLAAWLAHSPISMAGRCLTPTLLVQGEADLRCPPEQAEQFYNALRAAGCEAEMLRLPGASHTGSIFGPPATRWSQDEALVDWLTRFI